MKSIRFPSGILVAIATMFVIVPVARADDISGPAMAGLVLNNTSPDADLYALSLFAGVSTDRLHYSMTDTTTGFTETMTGTYAGQALNVTYTSTDMASFPGPVTWTSTGSYGLESWNGSGAATFAFPTASTFQVAYMSTLIIGSNTVSLNTTISGADDGTYLYYTGTTGTITVNGVTSNEPPRDTMQTLLSPYVGGIGYDDYEVNGRVTITSIYCIEDEETSGSIPTYIVAKGHLGFVPEPSTLVLASIGAVALFTSYWFRLARGGRRS